MKVGHPGHDERALMSDADISDSERREKAEDLFQQKQSRQEIKDAGLDTVCVFSRSRNARIYERWRFKRFGSFPQ
jgi:hypothetical protein